MLALLRFALNSSIFVDHNEFLDELTLAVIVKTEPQRKTERKKNENKYK